MWFAAGLRHNGSLAQRSTSDKRQQKRVSSLEAALQRTRAASAALRRVGNAVAGGYAIDELLQLIIDESMHVLSADRGTVYLLRDGLLCSHVRSGDEMTEILLQPGQGLAGRVLKTGKSLRIRDAYTDKRFERSWDAATGYRTQSVLAVPMLDSQGEAIGVLQMLNKLDPAGKRLTFTPMDTELLQALAAQAAVAMTNAGLIDRLRRKNLELAEAKAQVERSARDLELLYQLEMGMSHADSLPELGQSVLSKVVKASNAAAGALVHFGQGQAGRLYMFDPASELALTELVVQKGDGLAGQAMEQGRIVHWNGQGALPAPRRVKKLLPRNVCSATAAPLSFDGKIIGALVVYHDAAEGRRFGEGDEYILRLVSANVSTELRVKQVREERERAERLQSIGQLMSGLMHDLRTPLSIIRGFVQLMEMSEDAQLRSEHAQTVTEQFGAISNMQRDVLAYARGDTSLLLRKVYVANLLRDVQKKRVAAFHSEGIELKVDAEVRCKAYLDEGKIKRAIYNLVQNAKEALAKSKKGRITLGCFCREDQVVISVKDNGRGIDPGIRERLFEPFVTKGKVDGTGLGLAAVDSIVRAHGGRVEVESGGRGTLFSIHLPQRPVSTEHRTKNP